MERGAGRQEEDVSETRDDLGGYAFALDRPKEARVAIRHCTDARLNVKTHGLVGVLCAGLVIGLFAVGASATSYVDDFSVKPFDGYLTSFLTGTASTGLSYVGDNCDFAWDDTYDEVSAEIFDSGSASFTITSRDGRAFVFDSIYIDNLISQSLTITGSGPEPFTIPVPGLTDGTYSPGGGSKHVTEVVISNQGGNDLFMQFDTTSVQLDVPGMDVQGNGTTIVNGDTTPSTGDDSDLGTTPVGGSASSTFTIRSIGDAALLLTESPYVELSSNPSGAFSISDQPDTGSIASGGSETFTVRFDPSVQGDATATVYIGNSSKADPYTFTVKATGFGAPEIDVQRPASTSIADGGIDAQGSKSIGTQATLTYTVENTGTAQLSVTNITTTSPSQVTVDDISRTSFTVASGGGTETFDVQYTPTAVGAFSFDLDIANSDGDEGNYDITVSGTGIDTDPPNVSSIVRASTDPTNATSVNFTVTFNESVTGVDATDFVVDASGIAGASIGVVSGSGTTYTVPVTTGTGDGTLSIDVIDDDTIEDAAGNKLGGTGAGNGNYTAGEEYTIDKTAPTDPTPTSSSHTVNVASNDNTVDIQVSGASDASGSGVDGFEIEWDKSATWTPSPTKEQEETWSGGTFTATSDGDWYFHIATVDNVGNWTSTKHLGPFYIDTTKPEVTINQAGTQVDPTNASPIDFTAVFNEEVIGFASGDVTVGGTANPTTGTVTEIEPSDGTTYNVAVSGMSSVGTVTASIGADVAQDAAGNWSNASTTTDDTVDYDGDPPDVSSIVRASADPTNASSVDFTVTFDESVTGVDAADFSLDVSGITGASIGVVSGSGTTYTVPVTTGTGDGTLSIDVIDDDTIEDGVGNKLGGTGAGNGDFDAGETYIVDKTPPSVPNLLLPADGAYIDSRTPTLSWEASSDEGGSGLHDTNRYRYDVVGPDPKRNYTVNTSYHPTFSSDGVYTWNVYARDNAGNNSADSETYTFTIDTVNPDATIDQASTQADPTNTSPVLFTAVFDEPIDTGTFTDADVTVGGTASTDAVTVTEIASNGGPTFEVSIVVTGDGTVVPTIPAGGVEDLAGNTSNASTSTDNSVMYDITPPDLQTTVAPAGSGTGGETLIADGTFTVTFAFDDPVDPATFTSSDISVANGTAGAVAGGPTVFTSVITPTAGFEGAVEVAVGAGVCQDGAGNLNTVTDGAHSQTVDLKAPTANWIIRATPPGTTPTNGDVLTFRINFTEAVRNVDAADFDASGTTGDATAVTPISSSTYDVTVSGGNLADYDGVVGLTTDGGQNIQDLAGNPYDGVVSGANETYTVDNTDPDLTSTVGPGGTVNIADAPYDVTITFDGPVAGFTTGEIGVTNGTVASLSGGPTVWTASIQPTAGFEGVTTVTIGAGVCTDPAGNPNTVTDGTDAQTVDMLGPTPDIDEDPFLTTDPTGVTPIEFDVMWSEQVVGFDGTDITVVGTSVPYDASPTVAIDPNPLKHNVQIDAVGDGTVVITIPAGAAQDLNGNPSLASTHTDNTVTYDATAPTANWITDFPHTNQSMDDDCSLTFPIEFLVEDNCCIGASNVTVTLSNPPDVTVADTLIKTQEGTNAVRISGDVTLSDLTDGSATVTIDVEAEDCCGNGSSTSDSVTVFDEALPTISGFDAGRRVGRRRL